MQRMYLLFFLCFLCIKSTTLLANDKKSTNTSFHAFWKTSEGKAVVEKDVDLRGAVCTLPKGIILTFKGGVIRNGTLIGNNTELDWRGGVIFDNVKIEGSWNVQKISTEMFTELSYNNGLKNLFALASPLIMNSILIEKGKYTVSATKKEKKCLIVPSNTRLMVNGEIRMKPNSLQNYSILYAKGEKIEICGDGIIVGDKLSHTGTEGEWGMGIDFKGAVNASVNGLTIKDCWGDCIYVGGRSQNVLIENCRLDNGRRQGISVTKANGVTIRNCTITNVSGTNPQYAIDIEPNRPDSVDNIVIDNVTVRDCEGGFLITHSTPKDGSWTPWIGNVTISNCNVKCKKKYPIRVVKCEKVRIKNCTLYAPDGLSAITVANSGEAIIQNNNISVYSDMIDLAKNELRELVGKGRRYPIDIRQTRRQMVSKNKFLSGR